jgi:polygalacturonase
MQSTRIHSFSRVLFSWLCGLSLWLPAGVAPSALAADGPLKSGGVAAATTAPTAAPRLPQIPDRNFDITKYGAVGDGKTVNTGAIQKAIEAATKAGGGTVLIPAGRFVSGPIELGNNLGLHLAKEAVLLMSPHFNDFPVENDRHRDFITAKGAHDLRIDGPGIIDGQGAPWWKAFRAKELKPRRPQMIRLMDCERVEIDGISTLNPPNTHCSLSNCREVTIRSVTMTAPGDSPNTDALNVSGENYSITNCKISTGDDNIVLVGRSGGGPTENFTITDCSLGFGHGLSIGSHTAGGIRNVRVENVSFDGTTSGIRMKAARDRGGVAENLSYKNITMKGVRYPIFISSYYPKEPARPEQDRAQAVGSLTPVWRKITIENAIITEARNSVILWGVPELPIADVVFKNVKISAETGMTIYNARNVRFNESEITASKGPKLTTYQAQVEGMEGTPVKIP